MYSQNSSYYEIPAINYGDDAFEGFVSAHVFPEKNGIIHAKFALVSSFIFGIKKVQWSSYSSIYPGVSVLFLILF